MGTIALHRLTDWPVFHHVAPLLETLGVDAEGLDAWHYFYAKDAVSYPFSHPLTTKPSSVAQEALRAVGDALAHVGASLVGAPPGAAVFANVHLPATREELETVDTTVEVGTDVAHVLVGSYEAVEAISALVDPQAWPAAVKKHRCVGLETASDGDYTVRVLGSTRDADPAGRVPGATHRARFPLAIRGNTLTVSGIVGAGGTPTIAFPSGTYAADVFEASDGVVSIVVTPVKKAQAWTFGRGLPRLGLTGPA